jgi:cell division GTPase FtsZ
MDFASYANFVAVNKDPQALLDSEVLLERSQKTFGTFFQHFAASAKWTDGEPVAHTTADQANSKQVDVTMTDRIEMLTMPDSATWLCLAIIFILMLILITLAITLRLVYPPTIMKQKIECLADMLALIAGSEELLAHVQGKSPQELSRSEVRTQLGWFKDRAGVVRWGVEIEDAVEFFERPGHRVASK